MFNLIETNKTQIYAIGDIHGEFKAISTWIKQHELYDCALIFCGDFGLGFDGLQKEHDTLVRANKVCEVNNVDCYAIRGNHDDPDYYNTGLKNLNLSHFKPLSDYTVIKSPEHIILCLGGAVSTDRSYRKNAYEEEITQIWLKKRCSYEKAKSLAKLYWWEKEPFVYDEAILQEIVDSGLKIDTICSHAAPVECYPITSNRVIYWSKEDKALEKDLKEERELLSKTLSFLKEHNQPIKNWYHGHYHEHHTEVINNVIFHLLDMSRNGRMSGGPGGLFDMIEI